MYIADDSVLVPCLPFVLGFLPKLQLCAVCFQLVVSSYHLFVSSSLSSLHVLPSYAVTDASAALARVFWDVSAPCLVDDPFVTTSGR